MPIDDALPVRLVRWVAAAPDWDAVFADELPRVHNFFRYRFGPVPDLDDLTSRTFEKAWRARHRYRRDLAGFRTWLLSIARNVAIDHLRAERAHLPLDAAGSVAVPGTPEETVMRQSDAARLTALLTDLSDRDRELVALNSARA